MRLAQVLANLLTNSAKYTEPQGKIELIVQRDADAVEFRVRDNGIGIAADARGDIFKMFAQLRPAIERSEGGLGIGLPLAKGLVELHGGTIAVESEGLGRGSEFMVRIPCGQAAPLPATSEPRDKKLASSKCCNLTRGRRQCRCARIAGHAARTRRSHVRVANDGPTALRSCANRRRTWCCSTSGCPA